MDRVGLRRDAHHLRAAPGDRADIGFLLAVLVDHELFGGIDLGHRVGDFEVEDMAERFSRSECSVLLKILPP